MIIENKFEIGQVVYLKTDNDQNARIITSITVRLKDIIYELSCGSQSSWHYEFEMNEEKNVLTYTSN